MKNHQTTSRVIMFTAAAVLAGVTLTGCSALEAIGRSAGDAWSVTYELSVDSPDPAQMTDVSYLDMESRAAGQTTTEPGDVATVSEKDGADSLWRMETIAMAEGSVSVSATPPAGLRATCRILLDGTREIAARTGEPGAAVDCTADTPKFDQ